MMTTWFFLVGSAALVWTMPDSFAEQQAGAYAILSLQMMAFCLYAVGKGIWFMVKERAIIGQMLRDIFNAGH